MGWLSFVPVLPLGRLRRLPFVASSVALTAITVLDLAVVGPPACYLVAGLLLWPQLCIQARRLHDMGASRLWLLLPWALEAAGFTLWAVAVAQVIESPQTPNPALSAIGTLAGGAALLVALGFFILLAVRPTRAPTPEAPLLPRAAS